MTWFRSKPRHRHEWSAWTVEIRARHTIRASRDFVTEDVAHNVRRCVLPKCRITQEVKAKDVAS